jgi:site-specific recombinase XerD
MPKYSTETIHYLTQDEIKRLIKAIDNKRDKALFVVAYKRALRASEIGMLYVTDFDQKELKLRVHRAKGSISHVYRIDPDEVRLLKSYLRSREQDSPTLFPSNRGTPISRRQLDKLMKQYGEKAKLPTNKQHFHALRHSLAVHLYDAGQDAFYIQYRLGHSRIQNTQIYTHLSTVATEARDRAASMKLPKF